MNCSVNEVVSLPILLSYGSLCVTECYMTPLDGKCKLVLGHNWLRNQNPFIDWLNRTVTLPNPPKTGSPSLFTMSKPPELPTEATPMSPVHPGKPHISLVNALAYQRACWAQEATSFQVQLSGLQELTGWVGQVKNNVPDLSKVPAEYHQYAEVFSKEKSR